MEHSDIEKELDDLEIKIERLRALYDQYFVGLERTEPSTHRKDVERRLWVLRKEQIRNSGLRFRFQGIVQRFNTYVQHWNRVTREIETGTYRRDVVRAAQRFGAKEALTIVGRKRAERYRILAKNQLERKSQGPSTADGEDDDLPTPPYGTPILDGKLGPLPKEKLRETAERPPARGTWELSDARIREIHARYLETKRGMKDSSAELNLDALTSRLHEQARKLRALYPSAKSVDFEVIVKDGRTLLKPILR